VLIAQELLCYGHLSYDYTVYRGIV